MTGVGENEGEATVSLVPPGRKVDAVVDRRAGREVDG